MSVSKSFIKPLLHSKTPVYTGLRNKPDPCKRYVQVSHCIFDLDGAILDNHKVLDAAYKEVFEKYGQKYTSEWRGQIFGMTGKAMWRKVIKELKLKTEWEQMEESCVLSIKDSLANAPLRPGVERLITHLAEHEVPMALVTSMKRPTMEANTSHIQKLLTQFETIVCGGDDPHVTKSKPSYEIYFAVMRRFLGKPDPESCLVFEDSPIGIVAAKTACMQVVGVPCSPTTAWSLRHADEVVDTLQDFRPGKYGMPPFPEIRDSSM